MISETASESAWSTDVLNSDTSERPSDRLRELDQIVSQVGGIVNSTHRPIIVWTYRLNWKATF